MTRLAAGVLSLLCLAGCDRDEPARARAPQPPPDPIAEELARSVLYPPALRPTPEEIARGCADPASGCALYQAMREGRAVIRLEPPPACR